MDLSERATRVEREVRTYDVELRATTEGRTIEGLAAPFNSPAQIRDAFGEYTETILPGAFARTIADRGNSIKLLAMHDRQSFPLGNITDLAETAEGLRMVAPVANTTAGNDALTLVAERVATGLSIGFRVIDQTWNEDYTARQLNEVKLLEISLVSEPAYAEAGVTAIRDIAGIDPAELHDALEALTAGTADDNQTALAVRARSAIDDAFAANAPATVPQQIRDDLVKLYELYEAITA